MQCQEGCAIVTLILVRYSLHLDPEVLLELAGTVIWNLKLIWCDSWPGPASARLWFLCAEHRKERLLSTEQCFKSIPAQGESVFTRWSDNLEDANLATDSSRQFVSACLCLSLYFFFTLNGNIYIIQQWKCYCFPAVCEVRFASESLRFLFRRTVLAALVLFGLCHSHCRRPHILHWNMKH